MMAATSSFASHKGEARVTAGTSSKNCPKVSAGDVTHGTLHRFLTAAQNWRTTYHPTVAESAIMPYLAPGFCDNARLDDFYYQNSDCYNKYTPTEFRTAARKRFFSTTWYLDVRRKLDSLQQGDGSFADFHDAVLTQNRYLEGNPEHIKDALLVSTLKKGMHVDLSERCSEPDTEIAKMFSAIANGTADSSKDETVAHWVKLVEVEDEKLRRERIRNQRDARNAVNDLGLKRMHNNAFQSNAAVAAPVHSLPASIPSYLGPNNYANPSANVGALRPANQYASLGPSNQFGSRSYIQNSHLAPRYNENERWIMFFLAHFCINCRLPFQNHRKNDNVCDPCLAANYEIRDVNFINRWVQAHPNGFENRRVPNHGIAARQPRIITTEDVVRAVERVQANGGLVPPFFLNLAQNHASNPSSSSNSIPLGPSNHVAPLQSIPQNYVAPILHSHAFPPRISSRDNVRDSLDKRTSSRPASRTALMPPFSTCAVVGIDDDDSDYLDVDSGDYDEPLSPPARNVRPRHSRESVAAVIAPPLDNDRGRRADTEPLPGRFSHSTHGPSSRSQSRNKPRSRLRSRSVDIEDRVDFELISDQALENVDIESDSADRVISPTGNRE
ncbi:hypothetical protein IW262DRAFT_142773 [Armillaria fumosa]|nr:hypothetical protein IW262DRAFT_142773 [Armillaria fumosa]